MMDAGDTREALPLHSPLRGCPEESMTRLWAIAYMPLALVKLVEWVADVYDNVGEKPWRFLSHFGAVHGNAATRHLDQGRDYTNVIYAICWKMLLEEVEPDSWLHHVTNRVKAGNMIEGLLGIAWLGDPARSSRWDRYLNEVGRHDWAHSCWSQVFNWLHQWRRTGIYDWIHSLKPVIDRFAVLVHTVVREENPGGVFGPQDGWIRDSDCDDILVELIVAQIHSLRLGWPSAHYARPGQVMWRGRRCWIILKNPVVDERAIDIWMSRGHAYALHHVLALTA